MEIIMVMFIIFAIVFYVITDLTGGRVITRGTVKMKIYQYKMEFTTLDNEVLIHEGKWCSEGVEPPLENARFIKQLVANGAIYPRSAIKCVKAIPPESYITIEVRNTILLSDKYHDKPYFPMSTTSSLKAYIAQNFVTILEGTI